MRLDPQVQAMAIVEIGASPVTGVDLAGPPWGAKVTQYSLRGVEQISAPVWASASHPCDEEDGWDSMFVFLFCLLSF